jgi:hypothetical protein
MVSQNEALKILNNNKENRKYSKADAKILYEFIKALVEQHVSIRLKKYDYGKR